MNSTPLCIEEHPVRTLSYRLIEEHLYLARGIARRYAGRFPGRGLDEDDLAQEGAIGLLRAVQDYDESYGVPFGAYARSWVRQAIVQAIQSQARAIRLPSYVEQEVRRLAQARAALWQRDGWEPELAALAAASGIVRERVILLLQVGQDITSLDRPLDEDNGNTVLYDTLAVPDAGEQHQARALVADLVACLPRMGRAVITCRYQIGPDAQYGAEDVPLAYERVARMLGLTAARVKHLEQRALLQMRYYHRKRR